MDGAETWLELPWDLSPLQDDKFYICSCAMHPAWAAATKHTWDPPTLCAPGNYKCPSRKFLKVSSLRLYNYCSYNIINITPEWSWNNISSRPPLRLVQCISGHLQVVQYARGESGCCLVGGGQLLQAAPSGVSGLGHRDGCRATADCIRRL